MGRGQKPIMQALSSIFPKSASPLIKQNLAEQLRDRCGQRQVAGARVALAQNGGGFLGTDAAAMVVTVLST